MKIFLLGFFLFASSFPNGYAISEQYEGEAIIRSIDDLDLPVPANDASEVCLPENFKSTEGFTPISDARARDLFHQLERNLRARNRVPGGRCAIRRRYIQGYLRKLGISSGSLFIQCPGNNGHMRLIDQISRRRYTYSNFHDTSVVSVQGIGYEVFDVQFESSPVTLSRYLAQVEGSQKLKPLRNRSRGDRGYCYWSIR